MRRRVQRTMEKQNNIPVGQNGTPTEEQKKEDILLDVRHLKKYFPASKSFFGKPKSFLKAVDDVSFTVPRGSTLGIVGESGCGKTTLGRTVLHLHEITGGQIIYNGVDITDYNSTKLRREGLRTRMQIVFQDPYSSLPPRMTIGDIIAEAVKVHQIVPDKELKEYVLGIMKKCGLHDYYYERYPHEFSGGQRICIARALAVKPEFVVCDEPVSALDVSIQAQIVNLLKKLQLDMGLTYLFISHDLSVVKHISTHVGVMYLGSMAEIGTKHQIFDHPLHPYTQSLLSAAPVPDPHAQINRIVLTGDVPSPVNCPPGCKFHTRCPKCMDICREKRPALKDVGDGHKVACFLCGSEPEETGSEQNETK